MEEQLREIIRASILKEAEINEISPDLVASIIYQESYSACGNFTDAIWAVRYEDGFFHRYLNEKPFVGENPNYTKVSRATERRMRACSFGLMQIMLQTAREHGFGEPYGTALCNPTTNIEYGCKILAGYLRKYGAVDGVRRYNGSLKNLDTEVYRLKIESHLTSGRYLLILGED
jgi:hypothetical protein